MTPYTYHQYYLACINDGPLHRLITDAYHGYRGPLNRGSDADSRCVDAVDSFCRDLHRRFCFKPVPPGERDELYHAVIFRLLNGEDHKSVKAHRVEYTPPGFSAEVVREVDKLVEAKMERFDENAFRKFTIQSSADALELRPLAQIGTPCTSANTPTLPKTNQGEPMSTNINIEQRTYLNGTEAKNYSDAQLVGLIEQAEAEAERLRKVKTKSAAITARIAELSDGARRVADLLDARRE